MSGWSDLDLVVFLHNLAKSSDFLQKMRRAIAEGKGDIRIGIGIDLVYTDLFSKTRRFGGRPLAMTFEVAGYGKVMYGPNPFNGLVLTDGIRKSIEYDRVQSIRAELHNWRRSFIGSEPSINQALQRSTKTLLKLLKHETDPNLKGPYTYDAAYEHAVAAGLPPDKLRLFYQAVEHRKNWLQIVDSPSAADACAQLESGLAGYAEI